MKIKLTKQQIIIITITTLLLIIGVCFICRKFHKPISPKTVNYDNFQTYEQKLEHWKQQCDFQPGTYTGEQIRNRLGKNNKNIYFLHKKGIVKNLDDKRTGDAGILYTNSDTLVYSYIDGIFDDAWYFDTTTSSKPNYLVSNNTGRTDLLCLGSTMSNKDRIEFNTYADTTPPPNPADFGL